MGELPGKLMLLGVSEVFQALAISLAPHLQRMMSRVCQFVIWLEVTDPSGLVSWVVTVATGWWATIIPPC